LPEKKFRPLIVPIFIPHQGCPHRCVFCEQEKITSHRAETGSQPDVAGILESAIQSKTFDRRRRPQVAFYGGTFTRLPFEQMRRLLKEAYVFVKRGFFCGIRVSTRPDALDDDRLGVMKEYGVSTVEIGAQSMDDHVLDLSNRGHRAEHTARAVRSLRTYGFRVGIQLMPGLPGDSRECFRSTTTKVLDLHPEMARLYPALVIRGTELARRYENGRYRPLGVEEAVEICAESCIRLECNGIPVIRIGLMSSPRLLEKGQIIAGPWHTAFGGLVRSHIYLKSIERDLPRPGEATRIRIFAPQRDIPLLRGYRNQGLRQIEMRTGAAVVCVEPDQTLAPGCIRIEKV